MNKGFNVNIFIFTLAGLLFIFDFIYLGYILLASFAIAKILGDIKQ